MIADTFIFENNQRSPRSTLIPWSGVIYPKQELFFTVNTKEVKGRQERKKALSYNS